MWILLLWRGLVEMESVKGRSIAPGDWVHVYKNLHAGALSIRCKKTGLVVAYCDSVRLDDVVFHVSSKGRERVLENKVRSVHAWVEGRLVDVDFILTPCDLSQLKRVYYNPYKTKSFVIEADPIQEVHSALHAIVSGDRVYIDASLESCLLF